LYFENAAGRAFAHHSGFAVFQYLSGKRLFADLQARLARARHLLERNRWHRLLGDQRLMAPFTEEESTWIVEHWLDPARLGPKGLFCAVLLAHDVFACLSMSQVMYEAQASYMTYRLFETEEQAVLWLDQVG
jgi:hypothetical protein